MELSKYILIKLWHRWEIRSAVLVSLFLQGVLVILASRRKRATTKLFKLYVFATFFSADWIGPYALGLISNRQKQSTSDCACDCYFPAVLMDRLLSFWAPFLLLHLGGPDNITSLSIDQNQLWLKQLIDLGSHIYAIIFVLIRAAGTSNPLFLPTVLVFVAGIIKYGERTYALYLASLTSRSSPTAFTDGILEPNPGPDYERLSVLHLAVREAGLPTQLRCVKLPPKKCKASLQNAVDDHLGTVEGSPLDENSLLQVAYCFYYNFKGFMGGGSFSPEQRKFTRDFFLNTTGPAAFKLLEIEHNFVYEDLHTKAVASYNRVGYCIRAVSTSSIIAALLIFFFHDKRYFRKIDVIITYVLLLGAIFLEIISVFMLLLSDRNIIAFRLYDWPWAKPIVAAIVRRRRWCETISKFNLIAYCLLDAQGEPNKFTNYIFPINAQQRLKMELTSFISPIENYVKDKIFNELKMKAVMAESVETASKICSQRGDWVLMQSSCYSQLKWSLGEVEYGKSLLLWHIATDLCYDTRHNYENDEQHFCRTISEYMLYLLLLKPAMTAAVAGDWPQIFHDSCAEAKRLFRKRSRLDIEQARDVILSVNTDIEPVVLKGDASKSVLFDACRLAKQLLEFKESDRWKLMGRVWVELLAYAAVNCESAVHAKQPGQGGELLTFVWLLMNHLGLGKQFRQESAETRYRLVIKK